MFTKAAQLIPPDAPVLNDSKWMEDRRQLFDAAWSKEIILKNRPDSLIHVRDAFELIEDALGDGRDWIAGKGVQGPGQIDIEAVWPFQFLMSLGPGALPESLISEQKYPKVYSFVDRFEKAVKDAELKVGEPKTIDGDEAARRILGSNLSPFKGKVDSNDPLQLQEGEAVRVFPTDWGFSHKDTGTLISLNKDEAVIISKSMGEKEIRMHFPRLNFKAEVAGNSD